MNILDVLLKKGHIKPEHVTQARDLHQREGIRIDRALVKLGCLDEEVLLACLSEELGLPVFNLGNTRIDPDVLHLLPSKLVYRKHVVPVSRNNGTLVIATADPFDMYTFDEIRLLTGLEVSPVLATEDEIDKVIKSHMGVGGDTLTQMSGAGTADGVAVVGDQSGETQDLLEAAQEASVVKLVNEIFLEAINERASDIHVEPYEGSLDIRYRIDGVLQPANVPKEVRRFQAAIISRIKIMSQLNIAEKRLPQDGRIKLAVGGKQIDLRVSVIPMLYGEGVVMRVLQKDTVLYSLPQLGMAVDTYKVFNDLIARPHGIILVTGPTGSGKTTTLYAALQAVVNSEIKVLTIEDPVEYHLKGVNQIQVHPKIGFTFAQGLRACLRHDPDVIMIGEIRDGETAEAAIQASLTGHLVLSTLHTNDACSAATRLLDMGIEPFLVTSTLAAAMAQRLVRTICSECKEPFVYDHSALPPDFVYDKDKPLYHGKGCKRCRGTGYRGRAGIYELMVNDEEISERVLERASSQSILKVARAHGLRLLREDGWDKVRSGVTTPDEVIRSTNA